ncbi:hypothetical protein L1987_69280 [Smallanthus sonchifolius]|uniref:Uncharacterized protein n=1 Tax=Smallanthus sonchifolius TaxID=185202 RepID=A0ACB9B5U6_9ASTR|nr:hypothetical protein L1987_69280 [Smallanthus sonchifolius]
MPQNAIRNLRDILFHSIYLPIFESRVEEQFSEHLHRRNEGRKPPATQSALNPMAVSSSSRTCRSRNRLTNIPIRCFALTNACNWYKLIKHIGSRWHDSYLLVVKKSKRVFRNLLHKFSL